MIRSKTRWCTVRSLKEYSWQRAHLLHPPRMASIASTFTIRVFRVVLQVHKLHIHHARVDLRFQCNVRASVTMPSCSFAPPRQPTLYGWCTRGWGRVQGRISTSETIRTKARHTSRIIFIIFTSPYGDREILQASSAYSMPHTVRRTCVHNKL